MCNNVCFSSGECFKATLSKALGIALIIGSVLVKLPQIIKIYSNKSGEGINIFSVTLDLTAITIYASYNYVKAFPFSSWGDTALLAVQTLAIGILVLYYQGYVLKSVGYALVYFGVCIILMGGITPVDALWTLQIFNIPILLLGKLSQAYTNYKNGHTGQLSAITLLMLFFGSLARIFTSIQETGDTMSIVTYVASSFANTVLAFQLLYYWNVVIPEKSKTD